MRNPMTRTSLIERLVTEIGLSKQQAGDLLEGTLELIKESLCRGESVKPARTTKKGVEISGNNPPRSM